jgi:hypothetical protein
MRASSSRWPPGGRTAGVCRPGADDRSEKQDARKGNPNPDARQLPALAERIEAAP